VRSSWPCPGGAPAISRGLALYPVEHWSVPAVLRGSGGGRSLGDPDYAGQIPIAADVLESRKSGDPAKSYVASLYHKGIDTILKKVGEEATETVIAAKDGDRDKIIYETADLWFHTMVMLAHSGLGPDDVLKELERRFGLSGLEEKAARGK